MPDTDKTTLGMYSKLRKGAVPSARELLCSGPDKALTHLWDSMHQFDDFELEPTAQGASSPGPSSLVSSDSEDQEGPEAGADDGATGEEHLPSAYIAEHVAGFTVDSCHNSTLNLQSDASDPRCANVECSESASQQSEYCDECQEEVECGQSSSWKSSESDFR